KLSQPRGHRVRVRAPDEKDMPPFQYVVGSVSVGENGDGEVRPLPLDLPLESRRSLALSVGLPQCAVDDDSSVELGFVRVDRRRIRFPQARKLGASEPIVAEFLDAIAADSLDLGPEVGGRNFLARVSASEVVHELQEALVAEFLPECGEEEDPLTRGDAIPI